MIGDRPPEPPAQDVRSWVCPGCDTAWDGKPWKIVESPWMCFCSQECYRSYVEKNGDPADAANHPEGDT